MNNLFRLIVAWMILWQPLTAETFYVWPDAPGSETGADFTNAFKSLAALSGLVGDDDIVYISSSEENPFYGEWSINNIDRLKVICDKGPDGEANFTNAYSAVWTGGPVYQTAVSGAAPAAVVYDYKLDNIDGDVTGWALDPFDLQLLAKWKIPAEVACAPYGFLTRTGGTQSSPGDGEWGWDDNVLFVNPPGSPDNATVTNLCQYCPDGVNGIEISNSVEFSIQGRSKFKLYPGIASNSGYAIKTVGCSDCLVRDVWAWSTGYHTVGMAGSGGPGHRIIACMSNSVTGDGVSSNAWVFSQADESEYFGSMGEDLVFIGAPQFKAIADGETTADLVSTTWSIVPCLSHANATTNYRNIIWRRILAIDKCSELETFHSISNGSPGGYGVSHQDGTVLDATKWWTYPAICYDSCFKGRMSNLGTTAFVNCLMDRHNDIRPNRVYWDTATAVDLYWLTSTFLGGYVGSSGGGADREYIDNLAANSTVTFDHSNILLQSQNDKVGLVGMNTGTMRVRFISCNIDSDGLHDHAVVVANNSSVWTGNFAGTTSDGNNNFGLNLEGLAYHSDTTSNPTPWSIGQWNSNIPGGSTDVQVDLGWGADPVNYLQQQWLTSLDFDPNRVVVDIDGVGRIVLRVEEPVE